MIFSNSQITDLRKIISQYMSERRYLHTLGVETAAVRLGEILMPDRLDELRVAALLHDITKDMPLDKQRELLLTSDMSLINDEDLLTLPALHSFCAVPFVKKELSEFSSNSVLSAIFSHTLGSPEMSLFDEIIFVSDFIEEGRTYQACKETAGYVFENLSVANDKETNLSILKKAVAMELLFTIENLKTKKQLINSRTLLTFESYKKFL